MGISMQIGTICMDVPILRRARTINESRDVSSKLKPANSKSLPVFCVHTERKMNKWTATAHCRFRQRTRRFPMNRRSFLQSLPAAGALYSAAPAIAQQPMVQDRNSIAYVSSGAIDGPLARALEPPRGEPALVQSRHFKGLRFTGKQRFYPETISADTWYPSWAADGTLYASYADGAVKDSSSLQVRVNSQWEWPDGPQERWFRDLGIGVANGRITPDLDKSTTTGNATLSGDDPFALTVSPLEPFRRKSLRFEGYYPCANFFYQGTWYYGGYYCHRWLNQHNVPITYELGGFGGFRMSHNAGKTWQDTPHDDQHPLFPETGRCSGGAAIKMGTPHFVDFGRELEHSPDGYAYLAGHGTYEAEGISNWCSGDAISMARVRPSPQTVNDPASWEFFCGNDVSNHPIWSNDFSRIAPLIGWPGGAGCVNITYQPALRKYFGFLCGGWADGDSGNYNIWVVESDALTGPWFSIACLRGACGGQPYFVCMPAKFNCTDSRKITIFYSANWRKDRLGVPSSKDANGPGGAYSLCVAEFELV
jgi:hypothetical protein